MAVFPTALRSRESTSWEVVGVVGDVQATALDAAPSPVIYGSHLQMPEHRMMLGRRTALSVKSVRQQVRSVVESLSGLLVAFALARSIPTLLFGVTAADWTVYGFAAVVVLLSCLVATIGPALRARATNLSTVMRHERL